MALETGTYISDLVATNPVSGDTLNQADDHLRLLKSTLKNTFPNINGAVSLTDDQLNLLDSKSLSGNGYQKMPSGLIFQWGTATTNGSGVATFTYPVAFPTGTLSVIPVYQSGSLSTHVINSGAGTTTAATAYLSSAGGSGVAGAVIAFQALGY